MVNIDSRALQYAVPFIEECAQYAEVHTVTFTLNGQHGGIDLIVEGLTVEDETYTRKYTIS